MNKNKPQTKEDVWAQWVVYNESQLGHRYSVGDWVTVRDAEMVRDTMVLKETDSSVRTKITDSIRKKADEIKKKIKEQSIVAHTVFGDIPVDMFIDQCGNLRITPIERPPEYLLPGVDMELGELTRIYEHFKDKIAKEREALEEAMENEDDYDDQAAI